MFILKLLKGQWSGQKGELTYPFLTILKWEVTMFSCIMRSEGTVCACGINKNVCIECEVIFHSTDEHTYSTFTQNLKQ